LHTTIRDLEKYYASLTTDSSAMANTKDSRDRLNLFYSDATVTRIMRRDNDNANAAIRGNPNLTERLGKMQAYRDHGLMQILLKYIHPFFTSEESIDNKLIIRLFFEKEYRKLFETNVLIADNANPHTTNLMKYNVTETPYLGMQWLLLSASHVETRDRILESKMTYRLATFPLSDIKRQEMTPGQMSVVIPFNNIYKNCEKFIVSYSTNHSIYHTSHYDSYGVEMASKVIKKIEFLDFFVDNVKKNLVFDLDERADRKMLYKMYLADYLGTNSAVSEEEYVRFPQLADIPLIENFYHIAGDNEHQTLGQELVIDVNPSLNMLNTPDRALTKSPNLNVRVTLRSAIPAGSETRLVTITGIHEGALFSYNGEAPPDSNDNLYDYGNVGNLQGKTLVIGSRK